MFSAICFVSMDLNCCFLPLDSATNVFAIIRSFKFGSGEKVHKKTTKEETFNAIFQAVRVGNIRKET